MAQLECAAGFAPAAEAPLRTSSQQQLVPPLVQTSTPEDCGAAIACELSQRLQAAVRRVRAVPTVIFLAVFCCKTWTTCKHVPASHVTICATRHAAGVLKV